MLLIDVYGIPESVLNLSDTMPEFESRNEHFRFHLQYAVNRFRSLSLSISEVIVTLHPKRYVPSYEVGVEQIFIRVEGRVKDPVKGNMLRKQLAKALVRVVLKRFASHIRVECKVNRFEEDDGGFYTSWED